MQSGRRSLKDQRTFWFKRTLTSLSSAKLLGTLSRPSSGKRSMDKCPREGQYRSFFCAQQITYSHFRDFLLFALHIAFRIDNINVSLIQQV